MRSVGVVVDVKRWGGEVFAQSIKVPPRGARQPPS